MAKIYPDKINICSSIEDFIELYEDKEFIKFNNLIITPKNLYLFLQFGFKNYHLDLEIFSNALIRFVNNNSSYISKDNIDISLTILEIYIIIWYIDVVYTNWNNKKYCRKFVINLLNYFKTKEIKQLEYTYITHIITLL